ncbi:GTPase [Actinomyces wuliandei]|uniref:GTPase n=1 Tax=Actinomyces wuliandei TaxID=2057743 RepID=UPI000FD7F1FB|nr:GTPase [Actinomyces wuliandei]
MSVSVRTGSLDTALAGLERVAVLSQELGLEAETAEVRALLERVDQRRRLAAETTVVALVGPTGSGKSCVLNALAGATVAPTAVTRPTTTEPLALLPAQGVGAARSEEIMALMDWLGVGQRVQVSREAADRLGPHTALLDLPDVDSDEPAHRRVAERLAGMVDVLVWVLDPQKYADGVIHHDFLAPMAAHAEVMLVVLNQVDRLDARSVDLVLADLRRLLDQEGLDGAEVLPLSALTGAGAEALGTWVRQAAAGHTAATQRLAADTRALAARLRDRLFGSESTETGGTGGLGGSGDDASRRQRRAEAALFQAAAGAAGADAVAEAVRGSYVHQARAKAGWPPLGWLERLRRDPLTALHLGKIAVRPGTSSGSVATASTTATPRAGQIALPVPRTSLPQAGPAALAALQTTAHSWCLASCAALPGDVAADIVGRSDQRAATLAPALDQAVASTDLEQRRPPFWWSLAGVLQRLLGSAALVGGLWLVVVHLAESNLPVVLDPPRWGQVPWPVVLLLGGLGLGVLLALLAGLVASWQARRRGHRVLARLREATDSVVRERLLRPLHQERARWEELRALLKDLC